MDIKAAIVKELRRQDDERDPLLNVCAICPTGSYKCPTVVERVDVDALAALIENLLSQAQDNWAGARVAEVIYGGG